MSEAFVLSATVRADEGKGASRRLRRNEDVTPAIIYGGDAAPLSIQVPHKDLVKQLENEAFYSHVITLQLGDKTETVLLKDLQRHPAKPLILHADFIRVDMSKKVTVKVPLHFINEASSIGVKQQGGYVVHSMTELEVSCMPSDLPEFIEVDLTNVQAGQIVHISELNLPKGVTSVELSHGADHDGAVCSINKSKGGDAAEE